MIVFCIGIAAPVFGDDWKEQTGKGRWWQGDYKEEYWDGPCQVKTESKARGVQAGDQVQGRRWCPVAR